jgi:glycosyltransferase involved in cell wall biosynthesis
VNGWRVLLIHFSFPPDGTVGSQITAKFAKYLPQCGWEPHVLTAKERYYTQIDPTTVRDVVRWDLVHRTATIPHPRHAYLAVKALFNGSHRAAGAAEAPHAAASARSGLRRTLRSLLTVPDDVTGWIPPAVMAGLWLIKRHQIGCLFSSGPPWTNHLVAYILARVTGLPWAACFEDPWSQVKATVAAEDSSPLSLRLEARLERAVVARANAVICLNDHHRQVMVAQSGGLPAGKFITIPNGYDPDEFRSIDDSASVPPRDQFVVTYVGSIYFTRTPRHVFIAVRQLIDSGGLSPDRFRMQFIGDCATAEGQSIRVLAAECGVAEFLHLRPLVPRDEAIRAMQQAHILLVLAHDWVVQIPAKVYHYARVGRPILALAPEGATADFIRRSGAGTVVDPQDVEGIARALSHYWDRFTTGRPLIGANSDFLRRFDRRRLTADLSELLHHLTAPGRMPVPTGTTSSALGQ